MPTNSAQQAAENLRLALDAGRAGARKAAAKVGQQILNDVRTELASPMAPSQPGSPPARRTGRLQASYRLVVRGNAVRVTSDDPAAAFAEFGTAHERPRPHLRPAAARARVTITPAVAEAWAAAVRGAARGR